MQCHHDVIYFIHARCQAVLAITVRRLSRLIFSEHHCKFFMVPHEGVMYVAMPYLVFMEAMVSGLINGSNIPYFRKPCCLLHLTVLWARVRMGHLCPSFARNPTMPLCLYAFLCVLPYT